MLSSAFAQGSSDTLKSRMVGRLESIDAMRASRKVGESNQGILTARGKLSAKETALLTAENGDRKQVYALIAKKTGESAAVVGQKRADSLRKQSKAGVWLQDTKGKWYRKQ
ncbi:MAG: hypothetical protein ACI8T1_001653 [Verrucomicrobiales bacterium]|jgi:uncharacterized protein YdbL (DUF1318 family)